MCRKAFHPGKFKRLHVDLPQGVEDPREAELLRRTIEAFDITEDVRQPTLTDVDTYLAGKPEDEVRTYAEVTR